MTTAVDTYTTAEEAKAVLEKIQEVLQELNDAPGGVAAKLIELGCRGDRLRCHTCPIADYLDKQGFTSPQIFVTTRAVRIYAPNPERVPTTPLASLPMPDAVKDFIERFDHWLLPDAQLDQLNLPRSATTP